MPSITVRLSDREMTRLQDMAASQGTTISATVRILLASGIKHHQNPTDLARTVLNVIESDPHLSGQFRRIMLFPSQP